ncbi:uncharacterized protein CLUP02_04800 [Colletotrichum lupini]|uniref:Uncharacterized protein n=1 Tax=Colletotrichum lupini TaxID=145971 RepID=A0A9Q8SL09_9PEZI|nr:uncharacterized protein CLUP02_04800 [Colletotrichum lupini]UQC79321.1 hypothetical protein CLUP02_04800 [Colletotrichum lupini]
MSWLCRDPKIFEEDLEIVYLCRTTASWPGDMALSVTFMPSTLTTNAVLFGCDLKKPDMYDDRMTLADIITSRLRNSDTPVFHPMMLPTIFADVERDRQIELVREKLEQLGRRIDRITFMKPAVKTSASVRNEMETLNDDEKAMSSPFGAHHLQQGMSTSSGSTTLTEDKGLVSPCTFPDEESLPTAKLWQQISRLRVGLSNWRRQLLKMISHVEDLNRVEFAPRGPFNSTYREEQRLQFFLTGERIRNRLQELVDEYDEYIRECSHIMDGFSLATQLEISQIGRSDAKTNQEISRVNLDVAKMTRRDGSIMKSIAVLGMIFLPASFATAFFSMDFFDLPKQGKGGILSSLFWIYVLAAVLLTLGTMAIFYFCILKKRDKEVESDRSSTAVSLV